MRDFKVYQASGYLTKLVTDASVVRKKYEEISGSLVQFDTTISAPLASLIVDINPIQDLHGQDSPYPAGGGANKFPNIVWEDNPAASKPNSWTVNGSVITLSKLASNKATMTAGFDISLKAGVTYSLSVKSIKLDNGVTLTNPNLSVVATDDSTQTFGSSWEGFTPNKDIAHLRLSIVYGDSNWQTATLTNVQVEEGSSATPYKPYANICPITGWTGCEVWVKDEYDTTLPATASVTFPDTVYGGKYEFVSGGLMSKMASVDLGTLTWSVASSAQSGKGRFTATLAGVKINLNTETVPNIKCSELKPITPTQAFNNNDGITISASSEIVIAYVDSLAKVSAADFKTAMSGVQLVYELATPVEYQITPEEINTLIGVNNIWADTGDVSVKYRTH